jgi:Tfp pilus assembly protein PilN
MIDYAAMLRPRTPCRILGYMAAVSIALAALVIGRMAYMAHQEAAALARSNEDLRVRQAAARAEPSPRDLELQRQWTVLLQERAYPWAKVFRAVENVAGPEIELLEFRPDRRAGTLVLKGEGRTSESVMRYLERLQEDPTFSRVYLVHTASVERGRFVTRSFELRSNLAARSFMMYKLSLVLHLQHFFCAISVQ